MKSLKEEIFSVRYRSVYQVTCLFLSLKNDQGLISKGDNLNQFILLDVILWVVHSWGLLCII